MGNAQSTLCSINSPQPSPPPTPAKGFSQRPLLLSTDPPTLRSLPSTSSLGLSGSVRTRAPSLGLHGRSNSSSSRVSRLLPSLGGFRQRAVLEKRLSPNSEQLIAQEFGVQPGQTKTVSFLPSREGGRPSSPQDTIPAGRWVLGGEIPSPGLHMGEQLGTGGSARSSVKPRRWSLKELSMSSRRRAEEEQARMLPEASTELAGKATRPLIPPRSSSLTDMEQRLAKMEQGAGPETPPTGRSTYDRILLAQHQLKRSLKSFSHGDPSVTAAQVQAGWDSLLALFEAALVNTSSADKHVDRVDDAVKKSQSLLPGSGEHAAFFAEVADGCKEIVDIICEELDNNSYPSAGSTPPSWQLRLSDSFRRRDRTRTRSESGISLRTLKLSDINTREGSPRRELIDLNESVFVPPRASFMENDSPLSTPKLTESPDSHSVDASPFFPITPAADRSFAPSLPPIASSPMVFTPPPSDPVNPSSKDTSTSFPSNVKSSLALAPPFEIASDPSSKDTSTSFPSNVKSSLALAPPFEIASDPSSSDVKRRPSFNARLASTLPRPGTPSLQALPSRLKFRASLKSDDSNSPVLSQTGTFGPPSRSRESSSAVVLTSATAPAPWTRMDPTEVNRHSLVTINSPRDTSLCEMAEFETEETEIGVEGDVAVELSVE